MRAVELDMLELVHPENSSLVIVLLSTLVINVYRLSLTRNNLEIECGKFGLPRLPQSEAKGIFVRLSEKFNLIMLSEPILPFTINPITWPHSFIRVMSLGC